MYPPHTSRSGQDWNYGGNIGGPSENVYPGSQRPRSDTGMRKNLLAVMGITGVGKTSFINQAIGRSQVIENSLEPSTSEIQENHFDQDNYSETILIDTPGFDSPRRPDILLLEDFVHYLRQRASVGIHLSGIIYLHRITDIRMQGSAVKNLRLLRDLCGDHFLRHVTFVTTMWDTISAEVGERRETDLKANYWSEFLSNGAEVVRYEGRHSVLTVIERYTKEGLLSTDNVSGIEKDAIERGKPLQETVAGRGEVEEIRQKYLRREKRLRKLKDAQRDSGQEELDQRDIERQEEELEKEKELLTRYGGTVPGAENAFSPKVSNWQSNGQPENRNSGIGDPNRLGFGNLSLQPFNQPSPTDAQSSEPSWLRRPQSPMSPRTTARDHQSLAGQSNNNPSPFNSYNHGQNTHY